MTHQGLSVAEDKHSVLVCNFQCFHLSSKLIFQLYFFRSLVLDEENGSQVSLSGLSSE